MDCKYLYLKVTSEKVFTMKKGKISSEFLMKLVNKAYKIDLGDVEVTD